MQKLFIRECVEDKNGWIEWNSNNNCRRREYYGLQTAISYSPSRRYALIQYFENELSIIDLLERKVVHSIAGKRRCIFRYWCWFDEHTISLFTDNSGQEEYRQCLYYWEKTMMKPQMINESVVPFQSDGYLDGSICSTDNDISKMTIKGNDFLLVKSTEPILIPFNINAMGPLLPPIQLLIGRTLNYNDINGSYLAHTCLSFAYGDKVYFYLRYVDSHLVDRFLQVTVEDFDLETRNAVCEFDPADAVIFRPRQLNVGSYDEPPILSRYYSIWQQGPIVILCEQDHQKNEPAFIDGRRIWILNLEDGTIMEKIVEYVEFLTTTLYRGYLLFWKRYSFEFKFQWIGNSVPRLSDICILKLMSQETIHPLFKNNYDKLTKF